MYSARLVRFDLVKYPGRSPTLCRANGSACSPAQACAFFLFARWVCCRANWASG